MAIVLLVEDEPDSAELMTHILEMEGHRVLAARTGSEALLLGESAALDLVLLDVMLPGLDGFEVCRRLRRSSRTADLPIAFLSAKNRDEDRQAGIEAGANVYLAKPISRAALISAAKWLLDSRKAKAPAARTAPGAP